MSKKHKKENLFQELNEYKNKYLHQLADFENARKRMQKEKEESIQFAIENTLVNFLPILDSFEQALKFSKEASKEVQSWAMGFQMILTQFNEIFERFGIISYQSEGALFDPHLHEAREIFETESSPDGIILQEFAKGYKTKSRVIRPSQVKVAKKPLPNPTTTTQEEVLEKTNYQEEQK